MIRVLIFSALLAVAASASADDRAAAIRVGAGEAAAVFAGGCFWCVESDFDHVPGVLRTVSGYTGGDLTNPGYYDVTKGGTGHREAVFIVYDPATVSYEQLLNVFWRSVDPTDGGGQFCDRGESYTTAVFTRDEAQAAAAARTRKEVAQQLDTEIATPIEPLTTFYPAETYHQDYYKKNPVRYRIYRYSCGRNAHVEDIWGDQAYAGIDKQ